MKEVPDENLKEIALDGLKYFKKICEENDISYFLAYGTLLGAVRHQGYIPWDDDIDVWVPRKDYDKLLSLSSAIENNEWQLLSFEKEKRYLFPWAKLCHKGTVIVPSRFENGFLYGISIDIFPVDDCSMNADNHELAKSYSQGLYNILIKSIYYYSPYTGGLYGKKNILRIIKKKIKYILHDGKNRFPNEMANLINTCNIENKSSQFVHSVLSMDNMAYPKEALKVKVEQKFEDDFFSIPQGYDKLLRLRYGDYMQLPPQEMRVSNHTFKAYYK